MNTAVVASQVNQPRTTEPTNAFARTNSRNCRLDPRISNMAPKKNAAATVPADTPVSTPAKTARTAKAQPSKTSLLPEQIWSHYLKTTGQQTRLIDAFLAFLMAVGAIQFVYYFLIAKDVRATPSTWATVEPERLTPDLSYSPSMPSWRALPPPLANSS